MAKKQTELDDVQLETFTPEAHTFVPTVADLKARELAGQLAMWSACLAREIQRQDQEHAARLGGGETVIPEKLLCQDLADVYERHAERFKSLSETLLNNLNGI